MIDSVTTAFIETIGSTGFTITIDADSVTAIIQETGERFIVRFDADRFYDGSSNLPYKWVFGLKKDSRGSSKKTQTAS